MMKILISPAKSLNIKTEIPFDGFTNPIFSKQTGEIISKLNSCKQYLAKEVTKKINLKFAPKLIFRNDKSIDDISKIEKVLKSVKSTINLNRN